MKNGFIEEDYRERPWSTGVAASRILELQQELAKILAARRPVFLDTGFWIMAREAAFDENSDTESRMLLDALRSSVSSGKAFFPITYELLDEFTKQSMDRFNRTMQIVDELSLGVAMMLPEERLTVEVENFIANCFPNSSKIERPIWTRSAFMLGTGLVDQGPLCSDNIMRAAVDALWETKPSDFYDYETCKSFNSKEFSELSARKLRDQHEAHSKDISSHKSALQIEVQGASTTVTGIAAREMRRISAEDPGCDGVVSLDQSRTFGEKFAMMTAKALELDCNRKKFGTLYVNAALHAGLRSNKGQKLKANDLFYFNHAVAGLPYCDAFCTTEGSLKTFITSGHMNLDKLYECSILSSAGEIKAWLGSIP